MADLRALLDAATPGPWQRSAFVDGPRFDHMDWEWKEARQAEERYIVRGAGRIGTPECNQVLVARDTQDAALIVAAVNALPALLDVVEAARAVCASPFHSPEMEPTVVFDTLREALAALSLEPAG